MDIDPLHPLFGKSDPVQNFKMNVNHFSRSKAIWVHCKKHQKLSRRELLSPLKALSLIELQRLRNTLQKAVRAKDKSSTGQTWVTPQDRLD